MSLDRLFSFRGLDILSVFPGRDERKNLRVGSSLVPHFCKCSVFRFESNNLSLFFRFLSRKRPIWRGWAWLFVRFGSLWAERKHVLAASLWRCAGEGLGAAFRRTFPSGCTFLVCASILRLCPGASSVYVFGVVMWSYGAVSQPSKTHKSVLFFLCNYSAIGIASSFYS